MTEAYHQLINQQTMVLAMLHDAVPAASASAPPGRLVKLSGVAGPGPAGALRAPFSATECAWFQTWTLPQIVNIFGFRYNGGPEMSIPPHYCSTDLNPGHAEGGPMRIDRSPAPFLLVDAAGPLVVAAPSAFVTSTVQSFNQLDRSGVRAWQSGGVTRVEWIVPIGAPVFAMGQVVVAADGTRELVPVPGAPVVVSTMDEAHVWTRAQAYAGRIR